MASFQAAREAAFSRLQLKYREDQPRVPAGNPDGGQFADDQSGRSANGGVVAPAGAGRSPDGAEVPHYGKPVPGAVSVNAYHYSAADREELSGAYYGRGLKGAERIRLQEPGTDARIKSRIYFYVDEGQGVRPESGVGGRAHRVRLDNLYDPSKDGAAIWRRGKGDANASEKAIVDAGFDGYYVRNFANRAGLAVVLGDHRVPVVPIGTNRPAQKSIAELVNKAWSDARLEVGRAIEGRKYSEDQPREPAGTPEGGRFAAASGSAAATSATPAPVDYAVHLRNGADQGLDTLPKIAEFLNKGGPIEETPENIEHATDAMERELRYQLSKENSGMDWYGNEVKSAFAETAKLQPALKDPGQQVLFSTIAGIMSPATYPDQNWLIAAQCYDHFKATGVIPGRNPDNGQLWRGGPVSATKERALNMLNAMVKAGSMGEQKTIKWLASDHSNREINEARMKYGGFKSDLVLKTADNIRPGYTAFGPKVGPFVASLNGVDTHGVAVDRWATRTYDRYFKQVQVSDARPSEPKRRAINTMMTTVARRASIEPKQAQAVMWAFEQQLYSKLGTGSKNLSYADGARMYKAWKQKKP